MGIDDVAGVLNDLAIASIALQQGLHHLGARTYVMHEAEKCVLLSEAHQHRLKVHEKLLTTTIQVNELANPTRLAGQLALYQLGMFRRRERINIALQQLGFGISVEANGSRVASDDSPVLCGEYQDRFTKLRDQT